MQYSRPLEDDRPHVVPRYLHGALVVCAFAAAIGATACDPKATAPEPKTPAARTQGEAPSPNAEPPRPQASPSTNVSVDTPGLHVSDGIARACDLPKPEAPPAGNSAPATPEVRASFDFDSTTIGDGDKVVLAAVAKCMTEGALRGKSVSLVGRADARGEEEYNMGLGGSRADSVRRYLHDLGVEGERLDATSRGELDATGNDEAGWARDRRVDIDLAR